MLEPHTVFIKLLVDFGNEYGEHELPQFTKVVDKCCRADVEVWHLTS